MMEDIQKKLPPLHPKGITIYKQRTPLMGGAILK